MALVTKVRPRNLLFEAPASHAPEEVEVLLWRVQGCPSELIGHCCRRGGVWTAASYSRRLGNRPAVTRANRRSSRNDAGGFRLGSIFITAVAYANALVATSRGSSF